MITSLLSALCALNLNVSTLLAPADTLNHYIIDNNPVEHFDGSQLAGAKIKTYDISTVQENGRTIRIHSITTDRGSQPLIIFNGTVLSHKDLREIDPNAIKSISVLKGKAKEAEAYGSYGDTRNGVIIIKGKAAGN